MKSLLVHTFCAGKNAIIHAGGKPVLVDIDPLSWNIDCDKLEEKITPKTKAIIPVHLQEGRVTWIK